MVKIWIVLLGLLLGGPAFAMDCYLNNEGGPVEFTATVDPFAVPSNAQAGEKIWESSEFNITVYCTHNYADNMEKEDIYAWIDPYGGSSDPYYQLGVTYNGADYDAIGAPVGLDSGVCIDNNAFTHTVPWPELYDKLCSGSPKSMTFGASLPARFLLYVKLKAMPPPGYVTTLPSNFTVVQFDGKGGVNTLADAKNLKYRVTGLNNIRVLDCGATFSIFPPDQVVDFGAFSSKNVQAQPLQRDFTVKANKVQDATCSEGFKMTAEFYTDAPLLSDRQAIDLQNGLMLQILEQEQPLTFNTYTDFADFTGGNMSWERRYQARISPAPGGTIQPGPFSSTVIFKVSYY